MPCISAKRKTVSAANRQNALKRWNKAEEVGEHAKQHVGEPLPSVPVRLPDLPLLYLPPKVQQALA